MISQGGLAYVDDLENAAIKIRQFIDRIKTAAYGYAGLFDAIKIKNEELNTIYQYDLILLSTLQLFPTRSTMLNPQLVPMAYPLQFAI